MIVAWVAANEALQSKSGESEQLICLAIIEKVNRLVGPGTQFDKEFHAAKKRLSKAQRKKGARLKAIEDKVSELSAPKLPKHKYEGRPWGERATRKRKKKFNLDDSRDGLKMRSDAQRWRLGHGELAMVVRCGRAIKSPYTNERREQATELWQMNIGPLRTTQSGTTEEQFSKWAEAVPRGSLFYFAAAKTDNRLQDIPNLLSFHLPKRIEDADVDAWCRDKSAVAEAEVALVSWIEERIFKWEVSMDAAVRESAICWAELLERKEPDLNDTLADTLRTKAKKSPKAFTDPLLQVSGSEVDIVPWKEHGLSARLSLSWADNSGEMHHLDATSKGRHGLSVAGSVMPTYEEDKRFIYFVPEGVDIRDSVGTSLGERVLRSGIMKPVTLPLSDIISQLENDPIKDKFFELWSRETGLDLVSTIFTAGRGQRVAQTRSGNVPPASAYRGTRANQPFHRDKDPNKRIKNHLPVQRGDALWLFHQFITVTYLNGGEIDARCSLVDTISECLGMVMIEVA